MKFIVHNLQSITLFPGISFAEAVPRMVQEAHCPYLLQEDCTQAGKLTSAWCQERKLRN